MRETIIFLHGMVGNRNVFKSEIDKLKDEYVCISYDFYKDENFEIDFALSLDLLIEQLYEQYKSNGVKKAHLCTLSFGCIVATAFYEKYPHMVESLTFVGGYCCHISSGLHTIFTQLLDGKSNMEYRSWLKKCAKAVNPNKKQILEDSEAIFEESALLLHPNVFERAIRLQLEYDLRKGLTKINIPILWIMGEYDELYKETLADLENYIPHVQYREIKRAGHVAHIHQPDQFMTMFTSFLKKISQSDKKYTIL
ncbi:alpha/beta hydrolase [Metabacillus fastidiosus]|uniref:alpha/beta fold hydrolase n=1 Tax=Metabacillus fastidiosus TaxID=1458 RepID=UPI002E23964C|nr:alpha/beta hydrolase [Metabacillus fastidiosus]